MISLKHIISAEDFGRIELSLVFREAETLKAYYQEENLRRSLKYFLNLKGRPLRFRIISDASTRTIASFEEAIETLGGVHNWKPMNFSSIAKGETHKSTARVLGPYCDCIIIRDDKEDFAAQKMAEAIEARRLSTAIINAGCGRREHPTQTFTDLYTIQEKYPQKFTQGDLTYAFVGDVSHSRVIHSDLLGLRNFGGRIYLVGPAEENIPSWLADKLNTCKISIAKITNPLDVANQVDVWYFTRLQKNLRSKKTTLKHERNYAKKYGATGALLRAMKSDAIAMHPLPHGPEYPEDIDLIDQRFIHYKQADNGLFVRMALLKMIFAPNTDIRRIHAEHGTAEVCGTFDSIQIQLKDIISICAMPTCLKIDLRNNKAWAIKLCSLEKKLELEGVVPRSFCDTCKASP